MEHIPEINEMAESGIFSIKILSVNELTIEKILLKIDFSALESTEEQEDDEE